MLPLPLQVLAIFALNDACTERQHYLGDNLDISAHLSSDARILKSPSKLIYLLFNITISVTRLAEIQNQVLSSNVLISLRKVNIPVFVYIPYFITYKAYL